MLAQSGVPIPAGDRVGTVREAKDRSETLGYPLVLKALGLAHKTECNALHLNLKTADEVATAARELLKLSDQLYLETMLDSVVAELIVGVTRDDQFGLLLTIGSGGILVEIMQDSRSLLIPASRNDIETASPVKICSVVRRLSWQEKGRLRRSGGCDTGNTAICNRRVRAPYSNSRSTPLLLCAEGEGVFAADALIVLQEEESNV